MNHSIGTIISYCSNDYRFIDRCIEEARVFSKQIVIPVCDHFFDGTPENRNLLDWTYAKHPDCLFVEFAYYPDRLYSRYHSILSNHKDWAIFWAATTRYIGFHYLNPDIETAFFLDSDEIVEGENFKKWIQSENDLSFEAQRLAAYFYALKPNLRAKKVVNLPLLVKRSSFGPLILLNGLERIGAYLSHPGSKRERVVGLHGKPLIHHYSWVRTKEECYQKTRTWGHRHDENWPQLIERTFSGSKQIFNLDLEFEEIAEPYFDPLAAEVPASKPEQSDFPNVIRIDERDLYLKELEFL